MSSARAQEMPSKFWSAFSVQSLRSETRDAHVPCTGAVHYCLFTRLDTVNADFRYAFSGPSLRGETRTDHGALHGPGNRLHFIQLVAGECSNSSSSLKLRLGRRKGLFGKVRRSSHPLQSQGKMKSWFEEGTDGGRN